VSLEATDAEKHANCVCNGEALENGDGDADCGSLDGGKRYVWCFWVLSISGWHVEKGGIRSLADTSLTRILSLTLTLAHNPCP
jgi:hypothetical protein